MFSEEPFKHIFNKKRKAYKIFLFIIPLIIIIIFIVLNKDIMYPLITQREKTGIYEITKMIDTKKNIPKEIKFGSYSFPLPNGAVSFKNATYSEKPESQYLISYKVWDDYINNVIPRSDFKFSWTEDPIPRYYFESKDGKLKIRINRSYFTESFRRIIVEEYNS